MLGVRTRENDAICSYYVQTTEDQRSPQFLQLIVMYLEKWEGEDTVPGLDLIWRGDKDKISNVGRSRSKRVTYAMYRYILYSWFTIDKDLGLKLAFDL